MPKLSQEKIDQLRELLDSAEPDEVEEVAEEILEELEEAAENSVEEAVEDNESAPVVEELIEAEETIEEIAEESDEPTGPNAEESAADALAVAETAIDASGGMDGDDEPIVSNDLSALGVSAGIEHSDEPPRTTHWWYRPLR